MELRDTLIKVAQHGVQLVDGDRRDTGVEGGDEGLVVHIQPMQQVGDELIVLDGLAGRGEFIGEAAMWAKKLATGWVPFCA